MRLLVAEARALCVPRVNIGIHSIIVTQFETPLSSAGVSESIWVRVCVIELYNLSERLQLTPLM